SLTRWAWAGKTPTWEGASAPLRGPQAAPTSFQLLESCRGFFAECRGGFALESQRIPEQNQLASWHRLGKRHGHTSLDEFRVDHHFRHDRHSEPGRDHRRYGDELSALQD